MSKNKTRTSKTETDLDLDDLGDLEGFGEAMEFGDEGSLDADSRSPSRSRVVADLAKEVGDGALTGLIKNTAKKALPEDYTTNYHDAMDLASFTAEVVSKNKLALNKSTYRLGKEVSKLLPFKIGMLDRYLESQQSEYEAYRGQTEEQMRDAGVASETSAIFDKQLDVQKSLYARAEAQGEVDQKERLIQNKLSSDILANMDGNIAHQTAFTTQISKEYYKRSLELQFKSFYVQADTLKTMRDHYKAFAIQFTNIEKNTGLPDFVKLRDTEKLRETMREQAVSSIYASMVGNSKFLEKMKKKMSGFVQEKVENVTSAMDGATDMLDMVNSGAEGSGRSGVSMIGDIMASIGGETLGEKIAAKISPKIKERLKDNKLINTGANYMGTLGASASSALEAAKGILSRKEEEAQTNDSWLGKSVYGGLRSFLDAGTPGGEEARVKRDGYMTHNRPAIFDNNVHRSITEVIPMYLAKILQSSSNLASMYSQKNAGLKADAPLLQYDYEKRELSSSDNIASNIVKTVFKEKAVVEKAKGLSRAMISSTVNTASKSGLSKLDLSLLKKNLSRKDNETLLSGYIDKAAKVTGGDMSYDKLFKDYEKDNSLKVIVESDRRLKQLIDTMRQYTPQDVKLTDDRLRDLTRNYPIEPLKNLVLTTSKLAGAAEPHTISDSVATVLCRAFVTYLGKGKDVTPKSVVDRSGFAYLLEKDYSKEVKESIAIFSHDVRKLLEQGDMQLTSSVELMFAVMNKSLRDDRDISQQAFQTIADIYPHLVGVGELDASNTRDGILKITDKDVKYVTGADLVEAGGYKALEIKSLRKEKTVDDLLQRFTSSAKKDAKEFAEFVKANKHDPSAIAGKMMDNLKTYKTSVGDEIKKKKDKVQSQISELVKDQEGLIHKFENATVTKLIEGYDTTINQLQSLVESMQRDEVERLAKINETQVELTQLTNDTAPQREIGKLTKVYATSSKQSIKLLNNTISAMRTQRKSIADVASQDGSVIKDKVAAIRSSIAIGLNDIKTSLKEYEAVGKETTLSAQ